jgi:hypothetical protein
MYGFDTNKTLVFQKGPAGIEVSCNEMTDGFTGVEFRGEDGGTIEDVVFAHNLMVGYDQYTLKFDGTVGAQIYNNTFVNVVGDGLRLEIATLQQGIVRNNLWVSAGEIEDDGEFMFDHNGFWMVGDNAIPSDSDVNEDPLLDADYRLMPGSPMIDAGVDVGLPAAGSAPDIGWDEVDGDPCADVPGGDDSGSDSGDSGSSDGPGDDATDAAEEGGPTSASNGEDGPDSADDTNGGDTSAVGTDGQDGGANDDDGGGCGCRSGRDSAPLALLPFFFALRRRRAR